MASKGLTSPILVGLQIRERGGTTRKRVDRGEGTGGGIPTIRTRSRQTKLKQTINRLESQLAELWNQSHQLVELYRMKQGFPFSKPDYDPRVVLPGLEGVLGRRGELPWLLGCLRYIAFLRHYLCLVQDDVRDLLPGDGPLTGLLSSLLTLLEGLELNAEVLRGLLEPGVGPMPKEHFPPSWPPAEPGEGNVFRRKQLGLAACISLIAWLGHSRGGFLAFL
ncbi:uncharacterized protein [Narcine bancroftii]|uniref:uncharacterized protein n=1 Tax=Narcine bancroftii TaxID=1343680 RepID=UPI003831E3E0